MHNQKEWLLDLMTERSVRSLPASCIDRVFALDFYTRPKKLLVVVVLKFTKKCKLKCSPKICSLQTMDGMLLNFCCTQRNALALFVYEVNALH